MRSGMIGRNLRVRPSPRRRTCAGMRPLSIRESQFPRRKAAWAVRRRWSASAVSVASRAPLARSVAGASLSRSSADAVNAFCNARAQSSNADPSQVSRAFGADVQNSSSAVTVSGSPSGIAKFTNSPLAQTICSSTDCGFPRGAGSTAAAAQFPANSSRQLASRSLPEPKSGLGRVQFGLDGASGRFRRGLVAVAGVLVFDHREFRPALFQ